MILSMMAFMYMWTYNRRHVHEGQFLTL